MSINQKAFNTAIDVLAGEFPPESGITIEVLKRLCTAYDAAKTEQPESLLEKVARRKEEIKIGTNDSTGRLGQDTRQPVWCASEEELIAHIAQRVSCLDNTVFRNTPANCKIFAIYAVEGMKNLRVPMREYIIVKGCGYKDGHAYLGNHDYIGGDRLYRIEGDS